MRKHNFKEALQFHVEQIFQSNSITFPHVPNCFPIINSIYAIFPQKAHEMYEICTIHAKMEIKIVNIIKML